MSQADCGLATGGWRTEARGIDRAPAKVYRLAGARIDGDRLSQTFCFLPPATRPQPPVGGALQ